MGKILLSLLLALARLLPCCGQWVAVDLRDETHAMITMGAFFYAHKDLFIALRDELWAMEKYEYFYFRQSQGDIDISACTMEPDENGHGYPTIELDQVEPSLLHNVEAYFDLLNPDRYCAIGLDHWGSVGNNINLDRVVAFEFGFLDKPGNKIVYIVYSPKYRDHFVARLGGDWYLDSHSVVF